MTNYFDLSLDKRAKLKVDVNGLVVLLILILKRSLFDVKPNSEILSAVHEQ